MSDNLLDKRIIICRGNGGYLKLTIVYRLFEQIIISVAFGKICLSRTGKDITSDSQQENADLAELGPVRRRAV